jgi:hypothetical protein
MAESNKRDRSSSPATPLSRNASRTAPRAVVKAVPGSRGTPAAARSASSALAAMLRCRLLVGSKRGMGRVKKSLSKSRAPCSPRLCMGAMRTRVASAFRIPAR